jgi:trehalose synthase
MDVQCRDSFGLHSAGRVDFVWLLTVAPPGILHRTRRRQNTQAVLMGVSREEDRFDMLQRIKVERKQLADYCPIAGEQVIAEIRDLAEPLQGARIVHINATAFGGGVAEALQTMVPLMRDLGLEAEWQVIEGAEEFFAVTKACHNGLQGLNVPLTKEMKTIWQRYNQMNAARFEGEYDFVVVHDPQPAGLRYYDGRAKSKHWLWRSHIDTAHPNPDFRDFMLPYLSVYDVGIFTSLQYYVGVGPNLSRLVIIRPSLDPLSPKNVIMPPGRARQILADLGVDVNRPLMAQVSRYDPWKDPLGVIDVYRIVKQRLPQVQLVLMGSMASDDPEGWTYYEHTKAHANGDPDVHVLCFQRDNDREVNALQTLSDVVIQKSTREGFGLVITEALWKGKPVVGGNVGGIPLQVLNNETGFLVNSVHECAEKALYLLQHPQEVARMGAAAREHVRRNFLVTRHLADYLRLFVSLTTELAFSSRSKNLPVSSLLVNG